MKHMVDNKISSIPRALRIAAGAIFLCCMTPAALMAGAATEPRSGFDPGLIERIEPVADGITRVEFTNGITARIFSSAYLAGRVETSPSGPVLMLDDGERLTVITDIEDARIMNKGDGTFHPFAEDDVIQALGEIGCGGMDLRIDCYLLPYPRSDLLSSSARGSDIFLSPQVRELSFEGAAFIATHETGHAFQSRYLPAGDREHWNEYRRLRGIEDEVRFDDSAAHADRPVEIFAEDFRVLFGGAAARYDGRVENPDLVAPDQVSGLVEFYQSLVEALAAGGAIARVHNYPNPFNPATEIWIELSDAFLNARGRITVRIYDVSGAFVRELYAGVAGQRDLRLAWDGHDSRGRPVASAAYFCLVRAGGERVTRKLLLIK